MPSFELDYDSANKFVDKNKSKGFFWDGYTLIKWTPGHNGYMEKNGMYRNGQWGYATKFRMTNQGTWKLSDKYVKFA